MRRQAGVAGPRAGPAFNPRSSRHARSSAFPRVGTDAARTSIDGRARASSVVPASSLLSADAAGNSASTRRNIGASSCSHRSGRWIPTATKSGPTSTLATSSNSENRRATRGSSTCAADSYHRLGPVWMGPVMKRIVRGFGVASGTTDPAKASSRIGGAGCAAASSRRRAGVISRAELEPERAVVPAEREVERVVELVAPPSIAGSDEIRQRLVIRRCPRRIGEELLEQFLHRREMIELDAAERVVREVRDRHRCQSACRNLAPVPVARRFVHNRDATSG